MEDLQEQIDSLSNELVKSFLGTIDILASIVAAQERFYEGSHCRFVADKSAAVARYLGLSEGEIFEIETAALLHDIGKIGYSDTLLSKYPSEMTGHEFDLYTRHAEFGMHLLKKHSGFETIAEIVYQHHERLDGSGFPRHLRGDRIHIGACIIGVVDFYHNVLYRRKRDRLQSSESGSTPSSAANYLHGTQTRFAQAMNHLRQKTESLYHPKVVEAFEIVIEAERRGVGERTMMRVAVNQIKPGMLLADDYYTSFGLLVASRGEEITQARIDALIRFAETGEIPQKILILK